MRLDGMKTTECVGEFSAPMFGVRDNEEIAAFDQLWKKLNAEDGRISRRAGDPFPAGYLGECVCGP